MKKFFEPIGIPFLFLILTLIYLFPLVQGLILLPLDLLISNYAPWTSPNTILLKNPYMQDSIIQLFPWRHLVFESLTHGIIPFWNPYQQLGTPFMANIKPLVFYPFNIFFILGEIPAWHLLLFGQIFLSMLFCFVLARDFKLKILPSIFTALAFSLNSFMIGLLQFGTDAHTMIWWPLILLFTKRYLEKQQGINLLLLGLCTALGILGGQLQYMGYFFIFLIAFILYYGIVLKSKISTYLLLFISIGLGVGVTAIQLIPSIELFSYSHRGLLSAAQQHDSFSSGLLSPEKLFRLFAPDFFGNPVTRDASIGYIEGSGYFGVIALFFALFAIVFARKNIFIKFFSGVFLVTILLSLQKIGELLYFLHLPLITSGSAGRIFTLVLFSGAILSGFGLTEFINTKEKKKQLASLIVFVVTFLIVVIGSYVGHIFTSKEQLMQSMKFAFLIVGIFATTTILYLFVKHSKRFTKMFEQGFLIVLILITFIDLFRLGYRFLTFSNEKFLYPELSGIRFVRNATSVTLGRVYGLTEPEIATYLGVYTIETYNPLYLLRTIELIQSLQQLPPDDLSIDNKYFLTSTKDSLKYTLDVLGTEYIAIPKDQNPATTYFNSKNFEPQLKLQKVYTGEKDSIYKNQTSYPRFGLYYDYSVVPDDKKILTMISHRAVDLHKTVLLEEKLPVNLTSGAGSAKLITSNINEQTFAVTTNKPALFYISDTWYPGWQATINNKLTKIYRANYDLRAVLLPAGKSTLTFRYTPSHFLTALCVTIGSLLILVFLSILRLNKK